MACGKELGGKFKPGMKSIKSKDGHGAIGKAVKQDSHTMGHPK
jgi:hypothetical protein